MSSTRTPVPSLADRILEYVRVTDAARIDILRLMVGLVQHAHALNGAPGAALSPAVLRDAGSDPTARAQLIEHARQMGARS